MKQWSEIFGEQFSLFNVRYKCLKLTKHEADDYVTFAGFVNGKNFNCSRLRKTVLMPFHRWILIFSRRRCLHLTCYRNLRNKDITTKCQRLLFLKRDTQIVQQAAKSPTTNSLQAEDSPKAFKKGPSTECWSCGR